MLSVTDPQIEQAIRDDYAEFGIVSCPHTATATHTWRQLDDELSAGHDWILVATAHAAKFETIVEPIIGIAVEVPPGLAELLERPARSVTIPPELAALATAMDAA